MHESVRPGPEKATTAGNRPVPTQGQPLGPVPSPAPGGTGRVLGRQCPSGSLWYALHPARLDAQEAKITLDASLWQAALCEAPA